MTSATPLRWVDVDLSAVAHNTRTVRSMLGPSVRFTAVVKSDGYGHGAAAIARTVLKNGADDLAVAYLDEALALRKEGIGGPLLVLGPVDPRALDVVKKEKLAMMVDRPEIARGVARRGWAIDLHLEVNLGMGRWGIDIEDIKHYIGGGNRWAGLMGHPGYMPGVNGPEVGRRVDAVLSEVRRAGLPPSLFHVANSALLLDFPRYRFGRVRVGNLIYGINPTDKPLPLKNPWRARSFIVRVRRLKAGEAVGYGGTFKATRSMTVGVVPAGYAHGLTLEPAAQPGSRRGPPTYWGMVEGKKCPFVGHVGMGHVLLDLRSVPSPREGMAVDLPLRRTAAGVWPKRYHR